MKTLTTKAKKMNHMQRERERERGISRCNFCQKLIHEGKFTYIFINKGKLEKLPRVNCEECYNQLQTEIEEYYLSVSKWWKWGWIVNAVISVIVFIIGCGDGDIGDGFFLAVIAFLVVIFLTWITRLIWRPYSTIKKLIFATGEEEMKEKSIELKK